MVRRVCGGYAAVAGWVFFVSVWEKEKDALRRPQIKMKKSNTGSTNLFLLFRFRRFRGAKVVFFCLFRRLLGWFPVVHVVVRGLRGWFFVVSICVFSVYSVGFGVFMVHFGEIVVWFGGLRELFRVRG